MRRSLQELVPPSCLSPSQEERLESRPWNSDRCLALMCSIQELVNTVKTPSERIRLLESANKELSAGLELLESHGTPDHAVTNSPRDKHLILR